MAVECWLERLPAYRTWRPGDEPQLAVILGSLRLAALAQLGQEWCRVGSLETFDLLGHLACPRSTQRQARTRSNRSQVSLAGLARPGKVHQHRIPQLDAALIHEHPLRLVPFQADRSGEVEHLLGAEHRQAARLN